uniref:Uncharacterized protein n=1 Tax=Anguilla anguilla TaxID=7936 RepID=A0A0E9RZJ5_ANGAN
MLLLACTFLTTCFMDDICKLGEYRCYVFETNHS